MGVAYIFYNTGIRRRTDMKVGFIGGGNMASAMIGGMIQKGVVSADDILVSVRTEKSVERLNQPVWSPGDYGERSGRSRIRSCIPGSKAKPNKKYNKPRQKLHLTREDYRIDSSR